MTAVRSALYRGELVHARRDRFAQRQFRYGVYVACIDPVELPELHDRLRLFSYNRRNLFSLHDRDYAEPLHAPAAPGDQTRLITNLKVGGFVFNPVSFHLRYRHDQLVGGVAEVNNTYGGRHRYQLDDETRVSRRGEQVRSSSYNVAKAFFVSPFLHGAARYDFELDCPIDGDRLAITMRVLGGTPRADAAADAPTFVARLAGRRLPLADHTLAYLAIRYPALTAQIFGLIHLQALRLRAAGVPYHRPGPSHLPTTLEGHDVFVDP